MDHPTTTTGTDAGAGSNADLAVHLERIADQMAALPTPPRPAVIEHPAAVFGDQGLADAYTGFAATYTDTAASVAADHDAMIGHLRAAAAAYRTGDADAAEQVMLAGLADLTGAGDLPGPRTPPE